MAAVAVAGIALTACSSSPDPAFEANTPPPGNVIPARVIADDGSFGAAALGRPRFVPCQGLSGCARTSPERGDAYPGVVLPSGVDDQVEYSQEFIVYLVGAAFDEATFKWPTVHIRVRPRDRGFQMVKLAGSDVLSVLDPKFSFEDENGKVICTSGWEGCG